MTSHGLLTPLSRSSGPTDVDPARAVAAHHAVELLERLVSIPSPSGDERQACEYLVEWLHRHGWAASIDEAGNAVGVKGTGPNELLLLGHIDTFPGIVPVRLVDDCLHGRGAVDAKGPLCAFAVAATQTEVPQPWRVTLVGAVEEEATSSKGARHILAQRPGDRAPRVCIIGEPSQWDRITLGYKGTVQLRIHLTYPFAHSAGNQQLPAEAAVDLWHAIQSSCEKPDDRIAGPPAGPARVFDRLTPSLLSLNTRTDGVNGVATLHVGIRLPLHARPEDIAHELEMVFREFTARGPDGTAIQTEKLSAEPAYKAAKNTNLVRALLSGIRRASGTPRFVVKTGTSDMNVVGPHWPGTDMVAYGPGDSALDHTPKEHLVLAEYTRSIDVLTAGLPNVLVG